MYSIKTLLTEIAGVDDNAIFSESIFCGRTTRETTLLTNTMKSPLDSFTFTLIRRGEAKVIYNDNVLSLREKDLFLYLPGLTVEILEISEDYEGICLFIDSQTVLTNIFAGDFLNAVYFPAVRYNLPYVRLEPETFETLDRKLEDIIGYLNSDNPHKIEASVLIFSLVLIDLHYSFNNMYENFLSYTKKETLVIKFLQFLPHYCKDHRDIDFYAGKLQISKVYLSRIIKATTGLTVMEHIERTILLEAERLLIGTDKTLKEIAYELGFADHPSFTKFFKRVKAVSPGQYRLSSRKSVRSGSAG